MNIKDQEVIPLTSGFTSIDGEIRDETYHELIGKPESKIRDQVKLHLASQKKIFDEASDPESDEYDFTKVKSLNGTTREKVEQVIKIHSKLTGAKAALQETQKILAMNNDILAGEVAASAKGNGLSHLRELMAEPVSLSSHLMENIKSRGLSPEDLKNSGITFNVEYPGREILNAAFLRTAGWPPESVRDPSYTESARGRLTVLDIIPAFPTDQAAVKYVSEDTYTNAAAAVAENTAAAESEFVLTEKSRSVERIAHTVPTSEEQLEDVVYVSEYLDTAMIKGVRLAVDKQLLVGTGASNQLSGLTIQTGLQTEDWASALAKPLNTILDAQLAVEETGEADPDYLVINGSLWNDVRQGESTSGGYYFGNPQTGFADVCWGMPVIRSKTLSAATASDTIGAIVGDFGSYSELRIRRDFLVEVGLVGAQFRSFSKTIRASVRCAAVFKRATAFCEIVRP